MGAVNTTYTFTATDTITSTKMNNIIDQTTITTDAVTGDTLEVVAPGKLRVKAGKITSNELAANAVTTNKINNSAVTTAKIADLNVTSAKLADNSITGAKIADSSIVASKLNSGQTGTAPIIAARATLQMKAGEWQGETSSYMWVSVSMEISSSGSPRTVTVTSATNHGFLAGEPFFIYMSNPSTGNDQYFCGFVDTVTSVTQFTFFTGSTSLLNTTGTIYFVDPAKYNSINIKRVSPGRAVLNSNSLSTSYTDIYFFLRNNYNFNSTFSIPLSNADNGVIIGSDNLNGNEVGLQYFNFYSLGTIIYTRNFSIAVFA